MIKIKKLLALWKQRVYSSTLGCASVQSSSDLDVFHNDLDSQIQVIPWDGLFNIFETKIWRWAEVDLGGPSWE